MSVFEPIAIVGEGCVLPGAKNPNEFWDLLVSGKTALSEAPQSYWRQAVDEALSLEPGVYQKNRSWTAVGGYINGFDSYFDPSAFLDRLPELADLDPLILWGLYSAQQSLIDVKRPSNPKRIGMVVGNLSYPSSSMSLMYEQLVRARLLGQQVDLNIDPLNRFMSGGSIQKIATGLGIQGRAYGLDAACASGLYAISQACEQLHDGTHDMVLAGAVNRTDPLFIHVGFCALSAMSRSGQSRPFNKGADGLIPAEGAGFLALKTLKKAQEDGDQVLGLIRGIGLSNDGRSGGLLSPCSLGQKRALSLAYQGSGLSPDDVGYIECHATGTLRGDSTEVESLSHLFKNKTPIGSLKANIGHPITVAGIAGVIKLLHCFSNDIIPTTPDAHPVIPALEKSPFYVPEENLIWTSQQPRIAAVDSFGFGGNNAHLLLEAWQEKGNYVSSRQAQFEASEVQEVVAVACHLYDKVVEPNEDEGCLVKIDIKSTSFPPKDLQASLGQQLLSLKLVQEASSLEKIHAGDELGVYWGMGAHPDVCRFAVRARLEKELLSLNWSPEKIDLLAPKLEAAHVLGTMPNVVANRISTSLDAQGPSFTLSQEDGSGLAALEAASRALRSGRITTAIVGAVDLSDDLLSQFSDLKVLGSYDSSHTAALIILKTKKQAIVDGSTILSKINLISSLESEDRPSQVSGAPIARGLKSLVTQLKSPDFSGGHFSYQSAWQQRYELQLTKDPTMATRPRIYRYAASSPKQLLEALKSEQTGGHGPVRLAIWGAGDRLEHLKTQAQKLLARDPESRVQIPGLVYSPKPIEGKVAAIYTGAAAAYKGMGQSILRDCPSLLDKFKTKFPDFSPELMTRALEILTQRFPDHPHPFDQLLSSSILCQLHHIALADVLGLKVDAACGLSSGETNVLFAYGLWKDLSGLLNDAQSSRLYETFLGGNFETVKQAWGMSPSESAQWENYNVRWPVSKLRSLLEGTERSYISIIQGPEDCVLSGYKPELEKVLAHIPKHSYRSMNHALAIHAPVISSYASIWKQIHSRKTYASSIDIYSNYFGGTYAPNEEKIAESLTGQAVNPIDFTATVKKMWDDGVRIFIEHGPQASLSHGIQQTLPDQEVLSLPFDRLDSSGLEGMTRVAASLWAVGQKVSWDFLNPKPHSSLPRSNDSWDMSFPLTMPKLELNKDSQYCLKKAPLLELNDVGGERSCARSNWKPQSNHPGPKLSRSDLVQLSKGSIAGVLGPEFEFQEDYPVQVRMPEPPLLLCDRVLGIDGPAGVLGKGTIWTETDVCSDSWYLVRGHMPAGVFIEAGQADLLLVSWQGIDRFNQGVRRYRLLGCELQFHGSLPKAGETISYEIHISGHAQHGDVRLFFFHYKGYVDGKLRISVKNGQAGFFSPEELEQSAGVLWNAEDAPFSEQAGLGLESLISRSWSLSSEQLDQLRRGHLDLCFGRDYSACRTHRATPKIPEAPMNFIDRVDVLDLDGGPASRGYLRGLTDIQPDHWFFEGHFHNDQCMPGTLMAEACIEAMSVYLCATGLTLNRDGWRFEPVPESKYLFKCRGQVTPESRQLVYEVFVDQLLVDDQGHPYLFAHVLCTVDGRKAFLCERLGLRMVPDFPELPSPKKQSNHKFVEVDGVRLDHKAMLSTAMGHPFNAFGARFPYKADVPVPRLPGPPYLLMDGISSINADFLSGKADSSVEAFYECDRSAWFFGESGYNKVPLAIVMEIALQPCGWLAAYLGLGGAADEHRLFRNLDGDATIHELPVESDIKFVTRVRLKSVSRLAATTLLRFEFTCQANGRVIFEGDTSFGFFPPESMESQKGLALSSDEKPPQSDETRDFQGGSMTPARGFMKLLDKVLLCRPDGGRAGLGQIQVVKHLDPSQWFFKAHFYQDPVQPGSLGVEAMLQTAQLLLVQKEDIPASDTVVLEPIEKVKWHYRGQIRPDCKSMILTFELIERKHSANGDLTYKGIGQLWLGDTKLYEVPELSLRISRRK